MTTSPAGDVPRISTTLTTRDRLGAFRVRWGIGRMKYNIPPGLYAVGHPGPGSPVFATANYKLTFDALRKELGGLDAWVLVLDTRGINVWCAAGKGTFGTQEVIDRVSATRLSEVVSHRKLILPQLGAPGTAAHEIQKRSGFRVFYGPVRAADIPAYIAADFKASPEMRRVRFTLRDRTKLAAMELRAALKYLFIFLVAAAGIGLISSGRLNVFDFAPYLGAYVIGSSLVPVLLPWIPGRPFALKGALAGLAWTLILIAGGRLGFLPPTGWKQAVVYLLILPPLSAFLAMNFTGSSTYTSLSGVLKEMKTAVPLMALSVLLGVAFFVAKTVVAF
ncbi:MAG: acetyl-CoA synthase subunit gamma [Candidatus Aminicenantes bacterium RBG_13_63_10]|nr:MAG: acetyl-CoA synthase subunit gamma [Candidatus Aminicenantes bacterium RBG_13_63_10]